MNLVLCLSGCVPIVALLIDRYLGEPPSTIHPVVWMGQLLGACEQRVTCTSAACRFLVGSVIWCSGAAICTGVGILLQRWILDWTPSSELAWLNPCVHGVLLALLLKPLLSLRLLLEEALAVESALTRSLAAARLQTARICSRNTSELNATELRESAIESLAENLVDSVVAPVFWYALIGLPGAALYRWANTADAMWGYRSARYEWLGKCAARADDLLTWLPARLCVLLLWPRGRIPVLAENASRTPSPNGGWPMAAVALSIDVQLGKRGAYSLNESGRRVEQGDIAQVARLCQRAGGVAAVVAGLFVCAKSLLLA